MGSASGAASRSRRAPRTVVAVAAVPAKTELETRRVGCPQSRAASIVGGAARSACGTRSGRLNRERAVPIREPSLVFELGLGEHAIVGDADGSVGLDNPPFQVLAMKHAGHPYLDGFPIALESAEPIEPPDLALCIAM